MQEKSQAWIVELGNGKTTEVLMEELCTEEEVLEALREDYPTIAKVFIDKNFKYDTWDIKVVAKVWYKVEFNKPLTQEEAIDAFNSGEGNIKHDEVLDVEEVIEAQVWAEEVMERNDE